MWTASLSSEIYCSIRLGHPAAAREFGGSGAGGGPGQELRASLGPGAPGGGGDECGSTILQMEMVTTTLTERPGRSIGQPRGWK